MACIGNVVCVCNIDFDSTLCYHSNPARGHSIVAFSSDVTKQFCFNNRVQVVIRSHQYIPDGYRIMHGGHLINVFSARNYFDHVFNDGALILLAEDEEGNLQCRAKTLQHRLVSSA